MFSWRGELLPPTGDLVGRGKEHFKDLLNLIGTSSEENLKTWGWFATKYDVGQSKVMVLFQTQPSRVYRNWSEEEKYPVSSSSQGDVKGHGRLDRPLSSSSNDHWLQLRSEHQWTYNMSDLEADGLQQKTTPGSTSVSSELETEAANQKGSSKVDKVSWSDIQMVRSDFGENMDPSCLQTGGAGEMV